MWAFCRVSSDNEWAQINVCARYFNRSRSLYAALRSLKPYQTCHFLENDPCFQPTMANSILEEQEAFKTAVKSPSEVI